ncbi:MAG: zinc ribbon domain-containing protein [bacterium]|nr:zinc ribbon domain-containing protein [bacterium]
MPTYEYECQKCHHVFEMFQGITDAPVRRCPQCKGNVRRLLGTGAAVMFKGTGFYETDYKRKTSAPARTESRSETTSGTSSTPGSSSASSTSST